MLAEAVKRHDLIRWAHMLIAEGSEAYRGKLVHDAVN
jgi:hypothetical protein